MQKLGTGLYHMYTRGWNFLDLAVLMFSSSKTTSKFRHQRWPDGTAPFPRTSLKHFLEISLTLSTHKTSLKYPLNSLKTFCSHILKTSPKHPWNNFYLLRWMLQLQTKKKRPRHALITAKKDVKNILSFQKKTFENNLYTTYETKFGYLKYKNIKHNCKFSTFLML